VERHRITVLSIAAVVVACAATAATSRTGPPAGRKEPAKATATRDAAPGRTGQGVPLGNLPPGLTQLSEQLWDNQTDGSRPDYFPQERQRGVVNRWLHADEESADKARPVEVAKTGGTWDPGITKVLQVEFRPTQPGGSAPDHVDFNVPRPGYRELYIHEQVKFSPGFISLANTVKHLWIRRIGDPGSGFFFRWVNDSPFANNGRGGSQRYFEMNAQGLRNANQPIRANQGWDVDFNDDRVHRIEIHVQGGGGGVPGTVRAWVDGRLLFQHSVLFFHQPELNYTFTHVRYEHTYGGIGPNPPKLEWIWIGGTRIYAR